MRSALWQLTLARLRQFWRQPETIFWTFVFPALLAVALGVAFRGQGPTPVTAAVVAGPDAELISRSLREGGVQVRVTGEVGAAEELRAGRVALVVVPGQPLRYRFDPTRPESLLARTAVDQALQRAAGRRDPLAVTDEPVRTPGSRFIDFLVPGLLGMNLMSGGMWGLGWAIVESRTRKLLKRLLATPMRRRDFLLSLILARLAFVPVEVLILLVFVRFAFDVRVAGSWLSLAVALCIGTLSFAGLGSFLASRARTTETMAGLINLASLPMMLLSGVFFSVSRFPDAMQPFIRLLPLTALIDAVRGIMVESTSLFALGPQLLVLTVWGVTSFAAALWLFRWT